MRACRASTAARSGEYVDLSMTWSAETPPFPTDPSPVVRWIKRLATHGTNHQFVETPLHVGTHMDAPLHWSDGGGDVASIPLERVAGPAVVVDLAERLEDFSLISPADLESAGEIRDEDIVIVHTGYHRFAADGPEPDLERYFWRHPGAVRDLADWALERRLRWIGFDMASPDHPMNSNLRKTVAPALLADAECALDGSVAERFPDDGFQVMHVVLCGAGMPIVENIGGDIDALLGRRCTVWAFPWRFVGGEAAFVRVVASADGAS